jgi:hypothetical protein
LGAKSERRGAQFGNTRGKERQRRRTNLRLATPRVATALDAARGHQEDLEALIARQLRESAEQVERGRSQARQAVVGREEGGSGSKHPSTSWRVSGLPIQPVVTRTVDPQAVGQQGWSLGQARTLLRDGYHVQKVSQMTGYGAAWFDDLVGRDGYYSGGR